MRRYRANHHPRAHHGISNFCLIWRLTTAKRRPEVATWQAETPSQPAHWVTLEDDVRMDVAWWAPLDVKEAA